MERCGVRRNRKDWVTNKPEARIGPRVQERIGSQNLRTHTFEESGPVTTIDPRHLE